MYLTEAEIREASGWAVVHGFLLSKPRAGVWKNSLSLYTLLTACTNFLSLEDFIVIEMHQELHFYCNINYEAKVINFWNCISL